MYYTTAKRIIYPSISEAGKFLAKHQLGQFRFRHKDGVHSKHLGGEHFAILLHAVVLLLFEVFLGEFLCKHVRKVDILQISSTKSTTSLGVFHSNVDPD